MTDFQFVVIEWLDSCGGSNGWETLDKDLSDLKPLVCKSAGWLIHSSDDVKIIAANIADANDDLHSPLQVCGTMVIPSVCVLKITELLKREATI